MVAVVVAVVVVVAALVAVVVVVVVAAVVAVVVAAAVCYGVVSQCSALTLALQYQSVVPALLPECGSIAVQRVVPNAYYYYYSYQAANAQIHVSRTPLFTAGKRW